MRVLVAAAVVVLLVAAPRPARAWTLDYDVASECADVAGFRARVETQRLRGGDVDHVRIRVSVMAVAAARWAARVEIAATGPSGARELAGASCAEVHDAAILIVAQLLDGVARPVVVPVVTRRTMSPVPGIEDTVRPRPPDPPVTIAIGGGLGADVGGLAAPSAGARASLDAGWRRAVLALGATRWHEVTEVDAAGRGLSMSAWQVRAAARFRVARAIEVGAQFEIGEVSARGRGVNTALADAGSWQAIGPAAKVVLWRRRRLALEAELEVVFPIGITTLVVDGEPRYSTGPTVRVFFGAAWRLL